MQCLIAKRMAHICIVLSQDPTVRATRSELIAQLGATASLPYAAFLHDSVALANHLGRTRVTVFSVAGSTLLDQLPESSRPEQLPLADLLPATLAVPIAQALLSAPVILMRGDLPHLPIWRLRDTLTYLDSGADLVIGPGERGGWYLIGMRAAHPALLHALPAPDLPPDDLCIAAATHGLRMTHLPAWYTVDDLVDLDRLATDLRTMPPDVAPATRAILHGPGAQVRAVGS